MTTYTCTYPGCENGPATGHALFRTSPKGELFKGACKEHTPHPDPEVAAITDIFDKGAR